MAQFVVLFAAAAMIESKRYARVAVAVGRNQMRSTSL